VSPSVIIAFLCEKKLLEPAESDEGRRKERSPTLLAL